MNTVSIYHENRHTNSMDLVAEVKTNFIDIMESLEYAYQVTQNVRGSWSKPETIENIDGETVKNLDYNPNIKVLVDLKKVNGRVMGLRSSMEYDVFEVNGRKFQVTFEGFEELTEK